MASAIFSAFGANIWIADGTNVSTAGFHYGTRMVITRLTDGGLVTGQANRHPSYRSGCIGRSPVPDPGQSRVLSSLKQNGSVH